MHELYGEYFPGDASIKQVAATSLDPRPPEMLYDVFANLGVGSGDVVADIGSRDASYSVELHRRFGCKILAIDPVPLHSTLARKTVADAGLVGSIEVIEAGIEAMPLADGALDAIWCRDVLNHVDLAAGLQECARVLKPGGGMLVYQTFATAGLEPNEAARLFQSMAIVPSNMDPAFFEAAAKSAGFTITDHDVVDSEWRENWAESGYRDPGKDLLEAARLRRREAELVERFGRTQYEATYGGTLWGVYQFLGKLRPQIFVLRHGEDVSG
jgi:ubiquinone/menaquinone biosynthesis C-methylase UbiE